MMRIVVFDEMKQATGPRAPSGGEISLFADLRTDHACENAFASRA